LLNTWTRRTLLQATLAAAMLLAAGCGAIDDNGPSIVSMTVTPGSIPRASGGMTDQFFQVTIVTSGFGAALSEDARVFIQENEQEAVAGEIVIEGETIILKQIAQSWFQGLDPATYNIGATVRSEGDAEQVTQLNLAQVTVTP
jgi:hypothetical protein